MTTLLYRADAGAGIGSGHVMRLLPSAEEASARGARCLLASATPDEAAVGAWRRQGFEVLPLDVAIGTGADALALADLARRLNAGWIICDGYRFGEDFRATVKAAWPGRLMVFCDDDDGDYRVDALVNHNPGADQRSRHRLAVGTDRCLGAEWAQLRPEVRRVAAGRRPGSGASVRLLVTFGGYDADNVALRAMELLAEQPAELICDVVCTAPGAGLQVAQAFAGRHDGRFCVTGPTDLAPLMARADLALTAGGITILELAHCGIPLVIATTAANQQAGALCLEQAGAALWCGACPDGLAAAVAATLRLAASADARAGMAARGRALVDGGGPGKLASLLLG